MAFFTKFILILIWFYQKTISPDHSLLGKSLAPSGVCRFTPTCSAYAVQAIQRFGYKGLLLAGRRTLRCHPFTMGGVDPVPLKFKD